MIIIIIKKDISFSDITPVNYILSFLVKGVLVLVKRIIRGKISRGNIVVFAISSVLIGLFHGRWFKVSLPKLVLLGLMV